MKDHWKRMKGKNWIKVKIFAKLIAAANCEEKIRLVENQKETDYVKMRNDVAIFGDWVGDPSKYSYVPVIIILVKLSVITSQDFGSNIKIEYNWGARNR